jgi:multidrug efflux pump subunit AcrA (membrane-fusion protein)
VSVTGSATAAENVSLAFEVGGRVASIRKMVGDSVFRGETIAALDQIEFAANLQNAQGVLDAANARLSEYERGPRPEDIAVKEALLAQQVQDLDNAYQGVLDVLQDAYSSTDGAIRNTLDPLFSNDEFASVALSFTVSDSQKKIDAAHRYSKKDCRIFG